MNCPAAGWGMYPSQAPGNKMQCPLCAQSAPVGWTTVAGKSVRLIKEHQACR